MLKTLILLILLSSFAYASTPTFTVGTDPLIDITSTGTGLSLGDDSMSGMKNIGFDFTTQNTQIEGNLSLLNICVTGELEDFSRQSIKQTIKDNGGKFQSSVSSKTDILVSGINSGSKLIFLQKKAYD